MVKTGDWISRGWELVKPDIWMHVLICLILGAAGGTGVGMFVVPAIWCGWMWVFMQKMRDPGFKINIGDVFSKGFEVFVPSLIAYIIIGVFASVGVIACFVGAIVVQALTFFAFPLIIDRRMEFWPAIQASFDKTKGQWLNWSVFWLVLGLLNLAGALVCGIGVLVTSPITFAALTIAYTETFGAANLAAPTAPPFVPPSIAPPAA